jgi:hypothetical protein
MFSAAWSRWRDSTADLATSISEDCSPVARFENRWGKQKRDGPDICIGVFLYNCIASAFGWKHASCGIVIALLFVFQEISLPGLVIGLFHKTATRCGRVGFAGWCCPVMMDTEKKDCKGINR